MVPYINCFEVPEGLEDQFLAAFVEVNAYMASRPGYLGHRLHRALGADARYRFINYVHWASIEDWKSAHDERFRELVMQPKWAPFTSTPALYEVVHEGAPALDAAGAPTTD